jgi:hypothetical protein
MITSAGKRIPAKARPGGDQERHRAADITGQPCLTIGLANATDPPRLTQPADGLEVLLSKRGSTGKCIDAIAGV